MLPPPHEKPPSRLRARLHEIVFEADTPAGRAFDVTLIWSILISVLLVTLESVASIRSQFGTVLQVGEWFFTILFTIELVLRLIAVRKPLRYVFSFFGVVDFLAVLPTYLSLLFPGTQTLIVIRTFRLLRIFRVLKLSVYLEESQTLYTALRASRYKISVFLLAVAAIVVTMGAFMYVIEGEQYGFTSIPRSMYWYRNA